MDTYGLDYPIADIKAIISQYESVVGNFESAMNPNHVRTKAYTTTFSVHNRYLTVLTELGVTHVSLANNHAYDFGLAGYENARDSLAQAGLAVFGHPGLVTKTVSTSRIVAGDRAISLIGLNAVFARPDLAEVAAVIRSIPERDLAVCYIHWGTEYVTIHTDAAAELAAELARAGCETIIGHHPHVTQDIQIIDGVPVFYSLGNFLFDQYFSADVEEGYMLSLEILDDGRVEFEILPITSRYQRSRPQLMDQADKERFLKDLARRSDPRWSEYILAGKGFFNTNLATSTQTSIISP